MHVFGCVIRSFLVIRYLVSTAPLNFAIFPVTIVMLCVYMRVCVLPSLFNLVCHFFYVANLYTVLDLDR